MPTPRGSARPGTTSQAKACLIRDALPTYRTLRRDGEAVTLAGAVEAHVRAGNGDSHAVDAPALVERLRRLGPAGLAAVVDLAERMNAAVLRGDYDGRERVRREFGISG